MSVGDNVTKQNFDLLSLTIKSHSPLSPSPDFYIIRVSWGDETEATEGVIMYKSIMLSNREHTREVICRYEICFHSVVKIHPELKGYNLTEILQRNDEARGGGKS